MTGWAQGIVDFTATEIRQNFFPYAVMGNGIPVSDQYAFSTHVILQTGLNHQLRHANKWSGNKQRILKKMTLFQMWNIDMTIQSLVLSMHMLTSLLYILQRMSEKHPSTCYPAERQPKQNKLRVSRTCIWEKPVVF